MATRGVGSEWSMVGVEGMLQGCLITALCDVVSEFVGSTETWSVATAWHRGLGEECPAEPCPNCRPLAPRTTSSAKPSRRRRELGDGCGWCAIAAAASDGAKVRGRHPQDIVGRGDA